MTNCSTSMKREKKNGITWIFEEKKYTYFKLEKKEPESDSMKNKVKRSRTLGLANTNG